MQILELRIDDSGNEWGRIDRGWIAVKWNGQELARLDDSAPCWELPGARPAIGVLAGPGAKCTVLLEAHRRLSAVGLRLAVTVVQDRDLSNCLYSAGVFVIFRPYTFFPGDLADVAPAPEVSARMRAEYLARQAAGARFHAIQWTNEQTNWPSPDYLARWTAEASRICTDRGWRCIPTVWPPGHPTDLGWIGAMAGTWCELANAGHYYGANLYPVQNYNLSDRNAYTAYTTYRLEMIWPRMPSNCRPAVAITEVAKADGSKPPDLVDTANFIAETWGEFAIVTAWYYTGDSWFGAWPAARWTDQQVIAFPDVLLAALRARGILPAG